MGRLERWLRRPRNRRFIWEQGWWSILWGGTWALFLGARWWGFGAAVQGVVLIFLEEEIIDRWLRRREARRERRDAA